jgi:hypothetical protein
VKKTTDKKHYKVEQVEKNVEVKESPRFPVNSIIAGVVEKLFVRSFLGYFFGRGRGLHAPVAFCLAETCHITVKM